METQPFENKKLVDNSDEAFLKQLREICTEEDNNFFVKESVDDYDSPFTGQNSD